MCASCVSAPSVLRGAPFCLVNLVVNEVMTKIGMSLRRRQPQSPSVLHLLGHTYYQVCLTFLGQCPGVPLRHLGCFEVRVFSVAYIYISNGAAIAVVFGADPPEFRPVFLALHLILLGVLFWRDTQWTLVSPCAGVFAQLWNSALLVWNMFALRFGFCPCRDCRDLVFNSGAGWSPGPFALLAWGRKTVFTGPGNSFGLWCAPSGPLLLHE